MSVPAAHLLSAAPISRPMCWGIVPKPQPQPPHHLEMFSGEAPKLQIELLLLLFVCCLFLGRFASRSRFRVLAFVLGLCGFMPAALGFRVLGLPLRGFCC